MSSPTVSIEGPTSTTSEGLLAAAKSGGCASSSYGSSPTSPGEEDPAIWERIKDHPCFSEEAHHYFARMHVAVAPACNVQCN
ncbi:MAG: nitrogenase cofactor biosynthesis protein NifB, partial [Mesorhizobium sp.]